MQLVTIEIELAEDAPPPEPKLDEGEHIVQRVVPLKDLDTALKSTSLLPLHLLSPPPRG